jgi:hypothetical protein
MFMFFSVEIATLHATNTSTGSFESHFSAAPGAYVTYSPSGALTTKAFPPNP